MNEELNVIEANNAVISDVFRQLMLVVAMLTSIPILRKSVVLLKVN